MIRPLRGRGRLITSPSIKTLPLVGKRKPDNRYKSVLLPHPEGPKIAQDSPRFTDQLKCSKTGWLSTYSKIKSWTSIINPAGLFMAALFSLYTKNEFILH
jgi:hypothetical protein